MHALLASLLIIAISFRAQSAELERIQQQCAAEIEQQYGCTTACVTGLLPQLARCVNAHLVRPFPEEKLLSCAQRVQVERIESGTCEACGPDPVLRSFECAGR